MRHTVVLIFYMYGNQGRKNDRDSQTGKGKKLLFISKQSFLIKLFILLNGNIKKCLFFGSGIVSPPPNVKTKPNMMIGSRFMIIHLKKKSVKIGLKYLTHIALYN